MLTLVRVSDPVSEPVLLSEAKDHLREDLFEQDALIVSLISAAREHVESFTRRALITQTWKRVLDGFCSSIELPRPPIQSVSSITYIDNDGTQQTLAPSMYRVDIDSEPGRVTAVYGQAWPITQAITGAVEITYVAGYGNAEDVPQPIKQAMLMLVAHWYEHRQAVAEGDFTAYPMAVDSLLWPYRVLTL